MDVSSVITRHSNNLHLRNPRLAKPPLRQEHLGTFCPSNVPATSPRFTCWYNLDGNFVCNKLCFSNGDRDDYVLVAWRGIIGPEGFLGIGIASHQAVQSFLIQLDAVSQAWYAFEAARMMVKSTANRACQGLAFYIVTGFFENRFPGYARILWSIITYLFHQTTYFMVSPFSDTPIC